MDAQLSKEKRRHFYFIALCLAVPCFVHVNHLFLISLFSISILSYGCLSSIKFSNKKSREQVQLMATQDSVMYVVYILAILLGLYILLKKFNASIVNAAAKTYVLYEFVIIFQS